MSAVYEDFTVGSVWRDTSKSRSGAGHTINRELMHHYVVTGQKVSKDGTPLVDVRWLFSYGEKSTFLLGAVCHDVKLTDLEVIDLELAK